MVSYWIYLFAVLLLMASFFVPGGATGAGWTLYPPQAILEGTPGAHWGIILMLVSLAFFIIGFPGETKETLEETKKFIEMSDPPYFTACPNPFIDEFIQGIAQLQRKGGDRDYDTDYERNYQNFDEREAAVTSLYHVRIAPAQCRALQARGLACSRRPTQCYITPEFTVRHHSFEFPVSKISVDPLTSLTSVSAVGEYVDFAELAWMQIVVRPAPGILRQAVQIATGRPILGLGLACRSVDERFESLNGRGVDKIVEPVQVERTLQCTNVLPGFGQACLVRSTHDLGYDYRRQDPDDDHHYHDLYERETRDQATLSPR